MDVLERRSWSRKRLGVITQWAISLLIVALFVFGSERLPGTLTLAGSAGADNWRTAAGATPYRAGGRAAQTPTASRVVMPPRVQKVVATSSPVASAYQVRQGVRAPRLAVVDEHTVALYRLDSQIGNQVLDETGRYTATLHGSAAITSTGLFSGALWLDGNNSYLRTGYLGELPRGTIEAFVDFSTSCIPDNYMHPLLSVGGEFGSHQNVLQVIHALGVYLGFGIYADSAWWWSDSGINPCRYLAGKSATVWPYEAWRYHHVAITWGERGMEVWVDGVLHGVGVGNIVPPPNNYDYRCNPQMQIGQAPWPPNDLYPVCKTPVINVHAPVVYKGGMPAYATFLIGCDSTGPCFSGRIDDLRISDIQRTFEWTIVPTSSPTPTQTPDRVTGEYGVDSHTLALFHLNYQTEWLTVVDETGLHVGYLRGNANVAPSGGFFNGGVVLDGLIAPNGYPSYVNLGSHGSPGAGTVEAWFKSTNTTPNWMVIGSGGAPGPGGLVWSNMLLGVPWWENSTFRFGIFGETGWAWADSGIQPSALADDCWHHLAGTWGSQGMKIWVDGVLRGSNSFTGRPDMYLILGCDTWGNCLKGAMDEVRVSDIQRSFSIEILRAARAAALRAQPSPTARLRQPANPRDSFSIFIPFVQRNDPVCPFE